jgi:ABC-2 type transport system ATP-binding protein
VTHAVVAEELTKRYRVKEREAGIGSAVRALFAPTYRDVVAVDRLSFSIEQGEAVAFLGPNGAGKTTTLKMLTGLLYPTSGRVRTVGFNPWTGGAPFKCRITLVLGNKHQLLWDLPPEESFRLNKSIYGIPDAIYREQRDELVELLSLGDLLTTPARQLSLGERMKCELAAALLHRPTLLMLDEPTLGLDVTAQEAVRHFLIEYRARHGATLLLTSHYMGDVTALASRVLMINNGRLLYDGSLTELVNRSSRVKRLDVVLADGRTLSSLKQFGVVKRYDHPNVSLEVPREDAGRLSAELLMSGVVADLSIHDPPIEDAIRFAFAEGAREAEDA